MTTLTADSGSTKTTWELEKADGERVYYTTQGLNPFHMSEERMRDILSNELLVQNESLKECDEVFFYGAGCTKEKSQILKGILLGVFTSARNIVVDSDMLGAAKALFGTEEGIACILGTGANSCLYDGEKIVSNVSPMGYILGDEGSGAVLGKTFVNLLYKGGHQEMVTVFEKESGITAADIIQRVYREELPNRFLASLCPFISRHIDEGWIEEMVVECFRLFFKRNVVHYGRPTLPCSFVGSIAYYFQEQLATAAVLEGFRIGKVMKEPLLLT